LAICVFEKHLKIIIIQVFYNMVTLKYILNLTINDYHKIVEKITKRKVL